ncbi:subtilase-type protease inhibitor [Kitasatospora sp. NBC_01287]|uniref:SSI family serine proteinase inhibitor n=1 Tax=Kitasatospora sp. NBC_01287 TaxID=2903573 RepID=UPI00225AAEBD|nr:SSI family serine proteinase inhibitor [Kitasatospora sp. NBC_01287]MCX4750739.1 subtilase-type protease inhibitor [Kitasatospora sp. NBC_01287]
MISLRIRAALSALALALLTVPTPAQARPADPTTRLRLTIQDGSGSTSRSVELSCAPISGDHPRAQPACAAIEAADGDLDQLKGVPGTLCNDLYQPVTASAVGYSQGQGVRWQRHFANLCGLHTRTDPVFHF